MKQNRNTFGRVSITSTAGFCIVVVPDEYEPTNFTSVGAINVKGPLTSGMIFSIGSSTPLSVSQKVSLNCSENIPFYYKEKKVKTVHVNYQVTAKQTFIYSLKQKTQLKVTTIT